MNAIDIQEVRKTYANGFQALKGLTLSVDEGEFIGLLGVNGAGKSTLINTMAGLVKPSGGTVRIMGHDVVREREKAAMAIGVVLQEVVCDPFLSVAEVLRYQSGYYGLRHNQSWIDELIARLDLTSKADTPVRMLSGGMKRRVLLAQALVHRPPVIVLDEPTAGVDVTLREKLWTFIRELHRQGHTIVLTTHYLEEAQELCSRVALIHQGELLANAETKTLLQSVHQKVLLCRTQQTLPAYLAEKSLKKDAEGYRFGYADTGDLARLLTQLAEIGISEDALALQEARLQDVFVKLIDNAKGKDRA